jgi:hypothetical protein
VRRALKPTCDEPSQQGEAGGEDERGLGLEALGMLKAAVHERSAGAQESRDAGGLTTSPGLKDILGAIFRANPAYELVEFARLSPGLQAALVGPLADEDCFGVLHPREESGPALKSVGKEIALLFYALGEPGRLPAFVTGAADEEVNALIADLVLDEVLQIAVEGGFASGTAAVDLVRERTEPMENVARIAQVSLDAVHFGQLARVKDAKTLAAQLYFFNRVPLTPHWQRCLSEETALDQFLGTDSGSLADAMRAQWNELDRTPATGSWRRFSLRDASDERPRKADGYKVYVSPTLESIPDALPTIVDVFAEKRVRRFRIGADLPNLCRADKIVADLDSFERVEEVGRALDERVGDVRAQGVPFTADLCRDGLVSWGMDPHPLPTLVGHDNVSWRRWITHRLASALLDARDVARAGVEPWRFALQRVRQEGIDTDTWTPVAGHANEVRND